MDMRLRVEAWPALMTKEGAAAYLSCGPRTIDKLQAQGHLIPVQSAGGKRFAKTELDRHIEQLPEWGAR